MSTLIFCGGLLFLILLFALLMGYYNLYVSLIRKRNKAQEAFSSVDVQLKKRYDLIPNILVIAQKQMDYERGLIEEITQLRTQALSLSSDLKNINEKIMLDSQISQSMGKLLVSVENYPQIKSEQAMITAMQTYNEVEEHIAAARRFYNSAALELKDAVEIFPSSVVAKQLNIKAVSFFQVDEQEKQSIKASDYLK